MRILVVEDELDLNHIICNKLTKEGYNVDACFDGQAALDYLDGMIGSVDMVKGKMIGGRRSLSVQKRPGLSLKEEGVYSSSLQQICLQG